MAKLNLSALRAQSKSTTVIASGLQTAVIVQMADVGERRGYEPNDPPISSVGFCFALANGQQLVKTCPIKSSPMSTLMKIVSATDADGEFDELLGQQLTLDIEENGRYPKIVGYYHLDEQQSEPMDPPTKEDLLYYSVEEPDPEVFRRLHADLRQAISSRVRSK